MRMLFKNRTLGFWMGLLAAVIMAIAGIVFWAVNRSDMTFSYVTLIAITIGVAAEIGLVWTGVGALRILSAGSFGVALGYHLLVGLPSVSDKVNGVNFVGGDADMVITFGILFAVGVVLALVSSYLPDSRMSVEVETH